MKLQFYPFIFILATAATSCVKEQPMSNAGTSLTGNYWKLVDVQRQSDRSVEHITTGYEAGTFRFDEEEEGSAAYYFDVNYRMEGRWSKWGGGGYYYDNAGVKHESIGRVQIILDNPAVGRRLNWEFEFMYVDNSVLVGIRRSGGYTYEYRFIY